MPKCKSCGTNIRWVETKIGKAMPVDGTIINVVPGPGSTIIVTAEGHIVRGIQVGDAHEGGYLTGYTSHFATCPQAEKWRR
jgi:hypothetical protein